MSNGQKSVWVFGYGSLIWGTGPAKTLDRREGTLVGWHREWTWISVKKRYGAPTCSLAPGHQVRGVFLRLNPATTTQDLEKFRKRENRDTERTIRDVPEPGALTHFWTMGSNLEDFPEFLGLCPAQLAGALAERAKQITEPGEDDGIRATDYIRKVHEFDPDDALTAAIAAHL